MKLKEAIEVAMKKNKAVCVCLTVLEKKTLELELGKDFLIAPVMEKNDKGFYCDANMLSEVEKMEVDFALHICFYNAGSDTYADNTNVNELKCILNTKFANFVEFNETENVTYSSLLVKEKEKFVISNSLVAYKSEFEKNLTDSSRHLRLSTGFMGVDTLLGGGLRDGLYVCNGISGAGKTSFACEVGKNVISNSNTPVLYFSLEMSREELVAKMISSEMYKKKENRNLMMTAADIIDFAAVERNDKQAYSAYASEHISAFFEKFAENLYIYTDSRSGALNITVDDIRKETELFIETIGKKPLVIVDYFQLLAKTKKQIEARLTEQQLLDDNVKALKKMSNTDHCGVPILVISAVARDKYDAPLELDASKGSGGIEYTATVVLGIQPAGWDHKMLPNGTIETDKTRAERIKQILVNNKQRAAQGEDIDYEIKCVKARFASRGMAHPILKFNGMYSAYRE